MKIKPLFGQLRVAIILVIVGSLLTFTGDLFAQPANDQGAGNRNAGGQDPFQLPQNDDPFQLPGVQPAANPAFANRPPQFQDIEVNEKYAGWQQASDGFDGNRLDTTIRSNWVMADETGKLSGIVYGIEEADMGNLTIFLLNNGREVTRVQPKEDGTFVFSNIRQGVYGLVGWGDNAFFAFGLNVIRFNPAADENVMTELKITATPNETTINTDWIQFFSKQVKFPVYGRYITAEGQGDPARLYGVEGQSLFLPESRPQTSIASHQVIPASDGRVIGRVHQMSTRNGRPVDLRNTRIMLLQNDDVYAAVTTDSYGVFEFPEIPAGEYSCVAVGQDGVGCIGIFLGESSVEDSVVELEVEEDEAESEEFTPISFTMIPSEATGWINNLAIETAYQRVISRPIYNFDENRHCGYHPRPRCYGPGKLRPGGYRPPPRDAVPKEERFIPRANRFIDNLFFRDTPGF